MSTSAKAKSSISYQLLQPAQREEAITFTYDHFMPDEPMSKCQGCKIKTRDQVTAGELSFIKPCLDSGLSWCAVDQDNGEKIVGLQLNSIVTLDDLPDDPPTYDGYIKEGYPHYLAGNCDVMDQLLYMKQYLKQQNEEKLYYQLILGIHRDYRAIGIGTELAVRSLDHGETESGCPLTLVTCTSFYTQKIFGDKLEMPVVAKEKYTDCVCKGEHVLANMEKPHEYIITYVKRYQPSNEIKTIVFTKS